MDDSVIVVGAGVAGLAAGAVLARRGFDVTILERAEAVGGKLRSEVVGGRPVDAGPTVLTMRWALERVFDEAGARLDEHLQLEPLDVLARHRWPDGATLDLFADVERSAAAIEALAGPREADGYIRFARHAERIWELVRTPFVASEKPSIGSMLALAGRIGPRKFAAIDSTRTMWRALQSFFSDPRLLQLFGRYATYAGSSPMSAPGTLNCIAHVEREGVWSVCGGMRRIAESVRAVAEAAGARVRTNADVEQVLVKRGAVAAVRLRTGETLAASRVVFNGDASALTRGLLGDGVRKAGPALAKPSFSAVTLAAVGELGGVDLARHNVFFSDDYPRELEQLERGELPTRPTIYVCAQDRDANGPPRGAGERLFFILNAPATHAAAGPLMERHECETKLRAYLSQLGLTLSTTTPSVATTPTEFAERFPGTGGAIYGAATTGVFSSFSRAGSRTEIEGLYLAGGSVHPGSGVPMAALSGILAADSVWADRRSTGRWFATAMHGGTSMR